MESDSFSPWNSTTGYQILGKLDQQTLDDCRLAVSELIDDTLDGFFALSAMGSRSSAMRFDRILSDLVRSDVSALLAGYEIVFSTALLKFLDGGWVEMHQDWTYTDERCERAVVVWIALDDVDEDSGALHVIPGSHRWTNGIRPSNTELATHSHQDALVGLGEPVRLEAGQLLAFDPALVHGSSPNTTLSVRRVVGTLCAPQGTPLVHMRMIDGVVQGHLVDPGFFTRDPYAEPQSGTARFRPWTRAVHPRDFEEHLRTGSTADP